MYVLFSFLSVVVGVSGVAVGVLVAHGSLDAAAVAFAETALKYHVPYSVLLFVALIAVACWSDRLRLRNRMLVAIGLWLLGVIAFCGGLYVQAFTGVDVGNVIPIGGVALMLGWVAAGWSLLGVRKHGG